MVKVVNDQDFKQETDTGVTLTDFWATWCGPCKMQSPVIEALEQDRGDVKFTKMDVDQNPETPGAFGIMAIPTLIVKKDGEVVEKLVGYQTKDQLNAVLDKYTKTPA
ncbi:thioredoxin [Lacticaseibacillus jixianensis]|uniref:Thioredoxin n=1 Tax=Lacticaseibacillus jixianensis TaxID=2486012 RepID=A0ABW4BB01_9LACO|nr:thioredoxin [Lacticaseibacillus jixianensis]